MQVMVKYSDHACHPFAAITLQLGQLTTVQRLYFLEIASNIGWSNGIWFEYKAHQAEGLSALTHCDERQIGLLHYGLFLRQL